jgi:ligand-binding sensor domain-containing protein/two-component sensor histidine kinase
MQVGTWEKKSVFYWIGLTCGLLFTLTSLIDAEQLPIRTYTTADGLPRNRINRIVQDSHGFLWFCTGEGLSRFDGYRFTNYTTDQGLPSAAVNDLLETREGVYWVATSGGVCRFTPTSSAKPASLSDDDGSRAASRSEPSPGSRFLVYKTGDDEKAKSVNVLVEDHTGAIWCGTAGGLYRLQTRDGLRVFEFVDLNLPKEKWEDSIIHAIAEDRYGALWIGAGSGLYRHLPDGRTEKYTTENGLPENWISALLEDRLGHLWVGTIHGLCELVAEPDVSQAIVAHVYAKRDGLPGDTIQSLLQSSDGSIWVGMFGGLSEFVPSSNQDSQKFTSYTTAEGLIGMGMEALAEDRQGDIWIGNGEGAMKLARGAFTSYGQADGLSQPVIASIFETRAGDLCIVSTAMTDKFIHRFDGQRFDTVRPNVPRSITYFGYGWNQITFQDHVGEWWVVTGRGLYRFPKVSRVEQLAHTRPKAVYTSKNGLLDDDIFRLYEDSRGDIWIATANGARNGLVRWDRATETFHDYSKAAALTPQLTVLANAFREDSSGNLWIGFNGGLIRYAAGRFEHFLEGVGVQKKWVGALHLDRQGRLWIATGRSGLIRSDDPASDRPRFHQYTTRDGLSSNEVSCITEDQFGRIYAGTGRGLDQLDPITGRIKHYSSADGLAAGQLQVAFRDRGGALWFGTSRGLSRLVPKPESPRSPPPVLISEVRIAGAAYPISELGETDVAEMTLAPGQNRVQIDFVGLDFGLGERLSYQYKLEGADRDWSAPTEQRTVNYAGLSPGNYRFVVRAFSGDGIASPTPATVTFTILSPIWRRWWFVTLSAVVVGLLITALYRYRVARLLELERVRTHIASDLHDDIGSSLSRMAILSEVVKRQVAVKAEESVPMLTEIAESARGLVDSMSDIVWAIDPRRDDLSNVVFRTRRFASSVLEAKGIAWNIQVAPELEKIKLNPEQRRHLFLIFKEAVTNIARHSECQSASLKLTVAHNLLSVEIRDDGRGFANPPQPPSANGLGGRGLENIQKRAVLVKGHLVVESSAGRGTSLQLTVPLKSR